MTEAMPFLQKFDITFLRPPTIEQGGFFFDEGMRRVFHRMPHFSSCSGKSRTYLFSKPEFQYRKTK